MGKTFREFGIEPGDDMLDKLKGMMGVPIDDVEFIVQRPCKLPTRYSTPAGDRKFHMKTTYRPDQIFKFKTTEPAKKVSADGLLTVNFVFTHPSDPDSEIVLTPKDFSVKMEASIAKFASVESKPAKMKEPTKSAPLAETTKGIQETVLRRRKEALIKI